jgi:hypothetical protein
MWAIAVYDLGLTADEFYDLTPRQFSLLVDAHRKHLAHREMLHAYTTSAVINFAFSAPEKPVQPADFMPNYTVKPVIDSKPAFTEDDVVDWQAKVANLAAEMKVGGGPLLDELQDKSRG